MCQRYAGHITADSNAFECFCVFAILMGKPTSHIWEKTVTISTSSWTPIRRHQLDLAFIPMVNNEHVSSLAPTPKTALPP
jgi:hypothetical protein